MRTPLQITLLMGLLCTFSLLAENASKPLGEPVLEPPTLHCIGAYWIIQGDDNKNAFIEMYWRKSGAPEWHKSLPMFRVEKGAPAGAMMNAGDNNEHKTLLNIPGDSWLFAGSIVLLDPDSEYELKLALNDPDGGAEGSPAWRSVSTPRRDLRRNF